MKRKCRVCGKDIGSDAPGIICWTCFNLENKDKDIIEISSKKPLKEPTINSRTVFVGDDIIFEDEKDKGPHMKTNSELINIIKTGNAKKRIRIAKQIIKPHVGRMESGIKRYELAELLDISEEDCKIVLNVLTINNCAYKRRRGFLRSSKYYISSFY